jgi:uncharacterized protein (DUF433 family)
MSLAISAEPVPLAVNLDGVVRVGGTRVTLDTVITVFKQGATAEEIVYRYPSLRLGDVYASIAFYLNHQEDVEAYLKQRQQQAEEIRQMNEARFDPQGLRDRIDEEVRRNFNSRILQDRIALRMATQSEELFFEEMNERAFR